MYRKFPAFVSFSKTKSFRPVNVLQLCSLVIPELILLNLEKKQEISIERLYFNLGEQMRLVGRKYIVLSYAALSTVLLSSKC